MIESYVDAYARAYGDDTDAYVEEIIADAYAGMNRTDYGTNQLRADVKLETGQWQKKSGSARAPPAKMSAAKDQTTKNYQGVNLAEDGSVYTYDFLTSLPDTDVTMLPEVDAVRGADNRVDTAKVVQEGMKNARAVGTERDGKIFVRNQYTGKMLRIDNSSIRHGLNGKQNRLLTNARMGVVIGDIVKNAVPINALNNKAKGVTGTYAMAAYVTDSRGREFVAIVTAEQINGNIAGVEVYDVAHAVSGRQKKGSRVDTKSQSIHSIKATKISIRFDWNCQQYAPEYFTGRCTAKNRGAEKTGWGLHKESKILRAGRQLPRSDGRKAGAVCARARTAAGERAGRESERAGTGEKHMNRYAYNKKGASPIGEAPCFTAVR